MTNSVEEIWNLAKPKDSKGAWKENIWPVVRTNKGDLEKAWATVMRGKSDIYKENTLQQITLAMPVMARQRKGEGRDMPQPVGISVFIRQKRWIGCCDEPEEKVKTTNTCTTDGCNCEVHGPLFEYCTDHLARSYG